MKQVSSNYATLRNQTGSYYDVRLQRIVPGGNDSWTYVTYGMDKLKSIEITNALYDESGPKIGGVCASQCTVKLLEQSANWPRMAKFEVQVRASSADGLTKSSWISMGTYWTDTRKADKHGNLNITAYDWMLMLEQTWWDKIADASRPTYWPITARAMADLLVEATGMKIDSRSVLENSTRYIGLDSMSTAREMLAVIAAGLGGNWYITTEGKLLLVSHSSDSSDTSAIAGIAIAGKAIVGTSGSSGTQSGGGETTNVGLSVMSLEIGEELPAIDAVELTSDSGVVAKAGASSGGYTLRSRCNYADTNAAVLCLSRVSGYRYKPFAANGARLDPAAEVGDYVQIGNELFPIITITWRLGKHPVADIAAPFDEGVDHEYPMMSEDQKTLRKAKGYTNDTKTAIEAELEEITASFEIDPQEIRAKVDKVHQGEQYTFEWVLDDSAHTWYANGAEVMHVNSSGLTVAGEVKANSGFIGVTGDAFSIVPRHTDTEQDPVSGEDVQVTYPSSIQNGITKFSDEEHQGVYIGTDGIRLGPNFTVDKYGVITAKSGTIGGFTIGPNAIYSNGQSSFSGTGTGIHLSPNGIRLGDAFKVTPAGAVTASNITVTGGSITGGSINITRTEEDENTGEEYTVPVFSVSSNGYLNANFTGGSLQIGDKLNLNGNSLTLGGFTIGANSIYSTDDEFSVSISPNGINLGSTFHVDNQGNAYFGGTIYAQNISGAVTEAQLAQAVQTTLSYATAYNRAIQVNPSSYPEQFTATAFYAVPNSSNVGGFVNAQRYMTIAATEWGYGPDMENSVVPTAAHWHTFTEGTGANAGKIFIGQAIPATNAYANDHFFNIADTAYFQREVSAAHDESKANYISYVPTSPSSWNSIIATHGEVQTSGNHKYIQAQFNLTAGHQNSGSESTSYDFQSNSQYFNIDVTDIASGGIVSERTVSSLSFTPNQNYSKVNATFNEGDPQTNISLPTVYNSYTHETETLYDYAQYIGAMAVNVRSFTDQPRDAGTTYAYLNLTGRSYTDPDSSNPPYLYSYADLTLSNGYLQHYRVRVDASAAYDDWTQQGGTCPVMGINSMLYTQTSGIDAYSQVTVTFSDNTTGTYSLPLVWNSYARENETLYDYARYIGGREATVTSLSVTAGTYDSSSPYSLPVSISFSTNGASKGPFSDNLSVDVQAVYEAGQQAGGGSSTVTGSYYDPNSQYYTRLYVVLDNDTQNAQGIWLPLVYNSYAGEDTSVYALGYDTGYADGYSAGYTQGLQDAAVNWNAVRIFTDDVRAAGKYVDILYNGNYVATGLYVYYNGDED